MNKSDNSDKKETQKKHNIFSRIYIVAIVITIGICILSLILPNVGGYIMWIAFLGMIVIGVCALLK